jgi:hypothetical protein
MHERLMDDELLKMIRRRWQPFTDDTDSEDSSKPPSKSSIHTVLSREILHAVDCESLHLVHQIHVLCKLGNFDKKCDFSSRFH